MKIGLFTDTHYMGNLGVFGPIAKMAVRRISINFCNSADKVIVPTGKVEDLLYPII